MAPCYGSALIAFGAVSSVRISRRRLSVAFAASLVAVLALLSLGGGSAAAATCPSFRVLHDDRIGAANLPAGSYEVTVNENLGCGGASVLFARFLADWDGNLPKPWRLTAEGTGKASFTGGSLSFTVRRIGGGEGGGNNLLGKLCPGTFTVNAGSDVGPLYFAKGEYLVYLAPRSRLTCRRASVLFTKFLATPNGKLPLPWRVTTQIATFYNPDHPRATFRVEPEAGVS